FAVAGASYLTIHQEAVLHLHRALDRIRRHGMHPGVALSPASPLQAVEEVVAELDLLLIMTIDPGFGGQALIPAMFGKVARSRKLLDERGSSARLEVDGGVKPDNVDDLIRA